MFDQASIQCPRCNQETNNPVIKGTYHVCDNCNAILIPLFGSSNFVKDVIDTTDTFVSPTISKQNINWEKIPIEFLLDKGWSNPAFMIEKLFKGDYFLKPSRNPKGIGGWLVLFAIGLFAWLIMCLVIAYSTYDYIETYESYNLQDKMLNSYFEFHLRSNLISAVYLILLIILMFTKNKTFPFLVIIFLVLNLLFAFIDLSYIGQLNVEKNDIYLIFKDLIRTLILTAIWIPYFHYSTRVKNTFVKSFFKNRKIATT